MQATQYRIGNLRSPEPGFFPVVVSSVLGFLALALLIRTVTRKTLQQETGKNPWIGLKWQKTIYVAISLILYIALFNVAGFLLSTFLLMEFLFIFGNREKWILGTLGAFLSSGISYFIFKKLLDIQLPSGVIERLLGFS